MKARVSNDIGNRYLEYFHKNGTLLQCWKNKTSYVVGQATSSAAETLGFCCRGSDAGNSEKLTSIILQDLNGLSKPVLFPCGNLKKETIPSALAAKGIPLHSITVYETTADPDIETSLQHLVTTKCLPDYIVFFSPSGVTFSLPHLLKQLASLEHIQLIAIGPTTAAAMRSHSLPVSAVCPTPDPPGLVTALKILADP